MERTEVLSRLRQTDVQLVRFLYCDNGGVIRGKASHVDRLESRMHAGIGLTVAMQAMNLLDQLQPVEGMGPVGEVRLIPDPDTFVVLPYAPRSAAMSATIGRSSPLIISRARSGRMVLSSEISSMPAPASSLTSQTASSNDCASQRLRASAVVATE